MRSILRNHRFRRDARTLEDEEEMWFNTDEDDMEDGKAVGPPSDKMKSEEDLMEPISKFMERKKCKCIFCSTPSNRYFGVTLGLDRITCCPVLLYNGLCC